MTWPQVKVTFMVEMNRGGEHSQKRYEQKVFWFWMRSAGGRVPLTGFLLQWAVVEHISNARLLGAKTLFATHYHELTELEGKIDSVNNYCIAVKEKGE